MINTDKKLWTDRERETRQTTDEKIETWLGQLSWSSLSSNWETIFDKGCCFDHSITLKMKVCTHHGSTEGSTCTCIDFLGRSRAGGAAWYHSLGEGTGGGKAGQWVHGASGFPRERVGPVWRARWRPVCGAGWGPCWGACEACRRALTGGGRGHQGGGLEDRALSLLEINLWVRKNCPIDLTRAFSAVGLRKHYFSANHGIRDGERGVGWGRFTGWFCIEAGFAFTKVLPSWAQILKFDVWWGSKCPINRLPASLPWVSKKTEARRPACIPGNLLAARLTN